MLIYPNRYEDRAKKHFEMYAAELMDVLKEKGLGKEFLTEEEVRYFCFNAATIVCIRFNEIHNEFVKGPKSATVLGEISDTESLIPLYFLIRASLRYQKKYKMYPAEKIEHAKVPL